ncbi:MAG: hypothetical protein QXH20_02810 [Candidatus Bathyarchaeia archaeon]
MSKENENSNNKNKNVLNTVLNTVLNKTRLIRSFSVTPDKLSIYQAFCEIAKREGGPRAFSEVLLKAMEEYNKRHGVGNPQLLITHYVKPDEPQPMRVLCVYCNGALTDGRIFCQLKGGVWIPGVTCYSCKYNRLRKRQE